MNLVGPKQINANAAFDAVKASSRGAHVEKPKTGEGWVQPKRQPLTF